MLQSAKAGQALRRPAFAVLLSKRPTMRRIRFSVLLLGVLIGLSSCTGEDGKAAAEDQLLAKVHNKALYISDMEGMFPDGTSGKDSTVIIQMFANRWMREALLLHEAEQNIPGDLNIDKLVRDYRASLIRHNYEKILVQELLDSTVTDEQLAEFYERNKQQYQLETPIVRCYFVKVPMPVPEANELRQLWNNKREDLKPLVDYCSRNAEAYLLNDSMWYKVEDIAREMPKGTVTVDNISAKQDFSQRDDEYQYYFKVFEVKNRKDIAPLSYIKGQARKVILRNRKEKLLEDKIEAMFQRELRRNNIKTYY